MTYSLLLSNDTVLVMIVNFNLLLSNDSVLVMIVNFNLLYMTLTLAFENVSVHEIDVPLQHF